MNAFERGALLGCSLGLLLGYLIGGGGSVDEPTPPTPQSCASTGGVLQPSGWCQP